MAGGFRRSLWPRLIGCGGGGAGAGPGGNAGAFTTSVSGSIPLNGLTSEQATQLCNDVNSANTATFEPTHCAAVEHASAVLETEMFLEGSPTAMNAALQTQCSQVLTDNEETGCAPVASCDAATIASGSPACMATVADVVTCLNENETIARELLAATPACSAVTASSLKAYFASGGPFDTYNAVSMSASCEALLACNGIGAGS